MISNVAAGRLDSQIELLKPTKTVSSIGSHVTTYESVGKVWANVKQITLREAMTSSVELQTETYTVLLRYRLGVTQEWCVILPNQARYKIVSVNTNKSSGLMILGIELDNTVVQRVES